MFNGTPMTSDKVLVLDTHVWYWLATGDKTLSTSARNTIDQAVTEGIILVPAICLWEIGMLVKKGRIEMHIAPIDWLNKALTGPGLSLCPLTPDIAIESCNLPGTFHQDPADKLIVATARINGATLVTKDTQILKYGRQGHVKVLSA